MTAPVGATAVIAVYRVGRAVFGREITPTAAVAFRFLHDARMQSMAVSDGLIGGLGVALWDRTTELLTAALVVVDRLPMTGQTPLISATGVLMEGAGARDLHLDRHLAESAAHPAIRLPEGDRGVAPRWAWQAAPDG